MVYRVVWNDPNWEALDRDGNVVASGPNFHTVVNTALGLNPGRTEYQTVEILDDATMTGGISMPNWSRLRVQSVLTADAAWTLGNAMIVNSGSIEMIVNGGGKVDGLERARPVQLQNVTGFSVQALRLHNGYGHNVDLSTCVDGDVSDVTSRNPGDDGISAINSCTRIVIAGNDLSGGRGRLGPGGGGGSLVGSAGIEIEDGTTACTVVGNIVHGVKPVTDHSGGNAGGIHCIIDDTSPSPASPPMNSLTITGNVVFDVDGNGITVRSNDTRVLMSNCTVTGNAVDPNPNGTNFQGVGIDVGRGRGVTVTGNAVQNAPTGINSQFSENLTITGNTIDNTTGAGLLISEGEVVTINGNTLRRVATGQNMATLSNLVDVSFCYNVLHGSGQTPNGTIFTSCSGQTLAIGNHGQGYTGNIIRTSGTTLTQQAWNKGMTNNPLLSGQ